jgi:hypothetical protein
MKILKSLAVLTTSTLVLFACSEGGYVPATPTTTTQAQTVNPYTNQGVGTNPYLTNPTSYYNGLNGQAQTGLQNYAQQNLQNCAARSTPHFYAYTSQNGYAVRKQVSYTPNSCACSQGPCDCEQVLTQVRTLCGVETSNSSNSDYSSADGINPNSKILPLSITGADAKALYTRLAKEEDAVDNDSETKVRTGMNYKCMMDGAGKANSDYVCDIDVSAADGVVYEQFPVSATGMAAVSNPVAYSGSNVTAGGAGLNPDEAVIKIEGRGATFLYRKMKNLAKNGTTSDFPGVTGTIELGKNVMCYSMTPSTDLSVISCRMKVNTTTGAIEAATAN